MQGIVANNMANPEATDQIDPKAIRQSMDMPPHLQNAFERVVAAGMHLMFDKKTNAMFLQGLDKKPISELLGTGAVGVTGNLIEQSNGTIPGEVIIPAGVYLITEMADFYKKAGLVEITNQDVGEAVQIFIFMIIQKMGGDPEQMLGKLADLESQKLEQITSQAQAQAAPAQGV